MTKEDFLKILEEMPCGLSFKLKIGENEAGLAFVRKQNPKFTMEDVVKHNIEMDGWSDGFAAAVEKYKMWRNEVYLQLKNLK